jgi:hypothetical protein
MKLTSNRDNLSRNVMSLTGKTKEQWMLVKYRNSPFKSCHK